MTEKLDCPLSLDVHYRAIKIKMPEKRKWSDDEKNKKPVISRSVYYLFYKLLLSVRRFSVIWVWVLIFQLKLSYMPYFDLGKAEI